MEYKQQKTLALVEYEFLRSCYPAACQRYVLNGPQWNRRQNMVRACPELVESTGNSVSDVLSLIISTLVLPFFCSGPDVSTHHMRDTHLALLTCPDSLEHLSSHVSLYGIWDSASARTMQYFLISNKKLLVIMACLSYKTLIT